MKNKKKIQNLAVPIVSTLSMIISCSVLHMSKPLLSSTYLHNITESRIEYHDQKKPYLQQEINQAEKQRDVLPIKSIITHNSIAEYMSSEWIDSIMNIKNIKTINPENTKLNDYGDLLKIYSEQEIVQLYRSSSEFSRQYTQNEIDSIVVAEYYKMTSQGEGLPKTVNLEFLMTKKKYESTSNWMAVSHAKALGLYQVTIPIWKYHGISDWKNKWFIPEINVHIAMKHYSHEDTLLRRTYPGYKKYPIKIRQLILAGMDNWGFGHLMNNDGNFSMSSDETIRHITKIGKELGLEINEYRDILFTKKNINKKYKYLSK